jgi:hypothetical protein
LPNRLEAGHQVTIMRSTAPPRRSTVALAMTLFLAACGEGDGAPAATTTGAGAGAGGSGQASSASSASGSASGGSGGQGAASPLDESRCGLDFEWLARDVVGQLLNSENPQDELGVAEAVVAKALFASEGIDLARDVDWETLLHRFEYTTQDRGVARTATGFVIVPEADDSTVFPVLVWTHGTTGLSDTCAPSREIEDSDSTNFAAALLLSVIASFGYIIVAPDYLGQKAALGDPSPALHPYLIGEPTAVATWDAVRAGLEVLTIDGSEAEAGPIALWGASQGGHAALFAAVFHELYAPELDLRTAVYAIPPGNTQAHITWGSREIRSSTGNAVMFHLGANAWYEPAAGLDEIFVAPFDTQLPADAAAECSPDTLDGLSAIEDLFTADLRAASAGDTIANYEPWTCYGRENTLTTASLGPPSIPGLYILAADDTLVDTAIERDAFGDLCARGYDLSYLECVGAEHEEGFFYSIDNALDYIDQRLAGVPQSNACVIQPATTCANTPD